MQTETEKRLKKMVDQAKEDRQIFHPVWDDVREYFIPFSRPSFSFSSSNFHDQSNKKINRKVFDSKGCTAAYEFAEMIYGLTLNPAVQWLGLRFFDEEINQNEEARAWAKKASQGLLDIFASAKYGFPNASFESIYQNVTIGTTAVLVEEKPDGPYFSCVPFNSLHLAGVGDTASSDIRTLFTISDMSAREIQSKFPDVTLSEKMAKALEQEMQGKGTPQTFEVAHIVEPKRDGDPAPIDKEHEIASYYFAVDEGYILSSGGYSEMPIAAHRWSVVPGEVYGRSPSMVALPDVVSLQHFTKTDLISKQLNAMPPVMVPAGSVDGPVRIGPGAVVYYRGDLNKPEPFMTGSNLVASERMIEKKIEAIDRIFKLDVLRLPDFQRATTVEVQAVIQQKLQAMSPILSRMYAEMLVPVIRRTLKIAIRKGMIEKPEFDTGRGVKPEFVSQLALSQRAGKLGDVSQFLAVAGPIADRYPDQVADTLDADGMFRYIADLTDMPTDRVFVPREQAEAQRQARESAAAEMQAAMAASEAVKNAGQGAKAFSDAGIQGGTP